MNTVPFPVPVRVLECKGFTFEAYTEDQLRDYAAATSAALMYENRILLETLNKLLKCI